MLRWCILAVLVAAALANKKTTTKATTTVRTTTPLPDVPNPGDASAFCFACRSRRNHKDLYADPANCHNYYQCFYVNETFAIGYLRNCPAGQFWHDAVMTCMPEGATPCVDACLSDATSANKCYAGAGCRQFFVCSNTGSYGMCCPAGSQFNAATCGCDESATCNDACVQAGPSVPTSVAPATQYNSTVCRDSFGRYIATVSGEANAYIQIDVDGQATTKLYCAAGTSFELATCRCNVENGATVPTTVANRKAVFYTWFTAQNPKKDLSINHFSIFFYGNADVTQGVSAHWVDGGSLYIPDATSYMAVPGLKSFDYRNSGSWAASFRCEFTTGSYACSQSAGILSNNKDSTGSEFTIVAGVQATNSFVAKLNFWHPVNTVTLTGTFTPNVTTGWNTFVVSYDGLAARLYLNGGLADTVFVGSYLTVAHCPTVWGTDQQMGTFRGHIDDASIVRFALSAADAAYFHPTGDLPLDAQ